MACLLFIFSNTAFIFTGVVISIKADLNVRKKMIRGCEDVCELEFLQSRVYNLCICP